MTQQDKDLLLRDLSARLPYRVKVKSSRRKESVTLSLDIMTDFHLGCSVKPYLRPMASITEEERKEIEILIKENRPNPYGEINNKGLDNLLFSVSVTSSVLIDWLNSHHFDFCNLIKRGLAIDCTNLNIY